MGIKLSDNEITRNVFIIFGLETRSKYCPLKPLQCLLVKRNFRFTILTYQQAMLASVNGSANQFTGLYPSQHLLVQSQQ